MASAKSLSCPSLIVIVNTPNTLATLAMTPNNKIISSVSNTLNFRFSINTPVLSSFSVLMTYSTGPIFVYTGSNNPIVNNSTDISWNIANYSSGFITISNFNFINAPSTYPYTITFTTFYNLSSSIYKIDTRTLTIICDPGVMTGSVSAAVLSINSITQYTIILNIKNALIINSFISIVIPTISLTTCSSNITAICNTGSGNITLTMTSVVLASTIIKIDFTAQNPNSVRSISIIAFSYYSNYSSLVDNITSGMALTFLAKPVSTATVSPESTMSTYHTTY